MDKVKINYDHTYSSKYTRDYYRGKSFHYAGLWKPGAHYVCDAYNVDFIVHDSMMLVCKKNHTATAENEPLDLYELPDGLVGLRSDYWDVVMPALYGNSRYVVLALEQEKGTSQVHAMSQNAVTIELDALDEAIINNVERIDSDIAQKWSEINQTADQISATVAENRRISENADRQLQANITINAEAIATEVSDRTTSEGQIVADYNSKFTQTAREIATEVSAREAAIEGVTADYNSKISQTATQIRSEVNEHVETLEGEINDTNSALTQTAGEIRAEVASTKTDLEGQITTAKAEIKVTTDAITSTVEANKATADGQYSTLNSKIDQTADSITSTVEAYKEELDGTIADNYSVLDQKADSISATVAANKIDADGKIETVQSNLTQTATNIRAEVTANKQETDAAISDLSSSLTLTASEIRGEVAAHVETLEGEISDTNSTLSQTAEAIRSEVNSHVETLEGEIEETNSTLIQTASDIRSEVNSAITDTTTNITEAYTSAIEQTADEITTSVQQVTDSLDGRLTTAESNITQNANAITLETEARQDADTRIGNTLTAHQGLIESLQQQVDGAIDMHFYPGVPTLNNLPASEWTTDHEKDTHLGDLYYDKDTGYAYRFVKDGDIYKWVQIEDDAIAKALADAARAQETADGKMTIFYGQPSTYRVGDLWIMEVSHTGDTGDKKDCIIKKSTQDRDNNYVESDWVLVTDVANASKVKAAFAILADMINSEVGSYTSDNELVPGSIYSYIKQYKDRISLKVDTAQSNAETNAANDIKSKLLATGIDITDKKIEMTADNIVLKNNSGTRSLSITNGSDGKPIIAASNLQLDGVLSIGDWNSGKMDLEAYARSKADDAKNSAISTAANDATNKANNAQSNAEANAAADATAKANAAKANAEAAAKSDLATKLGYDSYEAMVIAAQNGNTIINGGYLRTNLIDTDALYVKHLNGADGTFTGALNAATGSFSGEVTATKFTISNDATVSGLKVSQVNGAASSSDLATTNNNVTAAKNRADSAYTLAQQASTAAGDAEINAKNDLAKRLGYASYDDMVEKAQAGKTIIDGAYIRTGLINADALNVKAANITGQLTASQINTSGLTITASQVSDLSSQGFMKDTTYISGGKIKTQYIDASALTISGSQISGTLTEGNIPTLSQSKISNLSTDLSDVRNTANTASTNASNAVTTANSAASTASGAVSALNSSKNAIADHFGYADYDTMIAAVKAGGATFIQGGYLNTNLIKADAVVTNYLSAHKITADQINTNGLVISSGQVNGLGSLATKDNVSASTDVTGLGSLATKNNIGTSDLDSTIISGGYIKTGLIKASELQVSAANIAGTLTASQIDSTNLHVSSANIDGTITATNLNAATGTFKGTLSAATGTFSGTVSAGTISGGSININNKFIVNSNGEMTATAASITGEINASSGSITGFLHITGSIYGSVNGYNFNLDPVGIAFTDSYNGDPANATVDVRMSIGDGLKTKKVYTGSSGRDTCISSVSGGMISMTHNTGLRASYEDYTGNYLTGNVTLECTYNASGATFTTPTATMYEILGNRKFYVAIMSQSEYDSSTKYRNTLYFITD